MASLFPPPQSPILPEFSSLLITSAYHPSAPIHLALSSPRTIILTASRSVLVSDLQRFNDAFLTAESGKGSTTNLTSQIEIFYPPSPAHLCLLFSLFRVAKPGDVAIEHTPVPEKTIRPVSPKVIILLEPSRYFLSEDGNNPLMSSNSFLSSYLNLVNRVFLSISELKDSPSDLPPKLVLFDSQLEKIPAIAYRPQTKVVSVIEKLFSCVGTFEEDSTYVPSSQSSERNTDEGVRKQLRFYCSTDDGAFEIQTDRWMEMTRPSSNGEHLPETYFEWGSAEY